MKFYKSMFNTTDRIVNADGNMWYKATINGHTNYYRFKLKNDNEYELVTLFDQNLADVEVMDKALFNSLLGIAKRQGYTPDQLLFNFCYYINQVCIDIDAVVTTNGIKEKHDVAKTFVPISMARGFDQLEIYTVDEINTTED